VGIVYKLSELLFSNKISQELKQSFLEIVALGTIADMMPREGENEIMIAGGLQSIMNSWRPGIKAFFRERSFENYYISQKVFKLISLLNVRDVQNQLPASYRLLTVPSLSEAKIILDVLIEKSFERKIKIEETREEVERRTFREKDPLVFEGDTSWELILLGSVASMISQKYQKPTFLFKKSEKESQGTARTAKGFDLVKAMKSCAMLLESYGGHSPAAGFRIKNENLEKFKECLIKYFKKHTK
jgi:single-stranded-DNA-specific exonuclease